MSRRVIGLLSLILLAVLFVCVIIVSGHWLKGQRIDLTEGRIHTLPPAARATIEGLKEPITLRFFFSRKVAAEIPGLTAQAARVEDLLREYASLSDEKIALEVIDPEPFSEAEDRAIAAELQAAPTPRGEALYFGLAGSNLVDGREVIPFFAPEREPFVEYDLTRMIASLAAPQKPVVGVITSLPLEHGPGGVQAALQGQSQPFYIYEELKLAFDIRVIRDDVDAIDPAIGLLVLAMPASLSEATLYAIDQFAMGGGRLLVLLDPLSEYNVLRGPQSGAPVASDIANLEPLMDSWGIAFDPTFVVGDLARATRVRASGDGSNRRLLVDYIPWLGLRGDDFAASDPATAELGLVTMAAAGALEPREGGRLDFAPIMRSSDEAMLISPDLIHISPNPERLLRGFEATGERYTLAARLTGETESGFPDGPPEGANVEAHGPHLAASAAPTNIIVIGDSDLIDDRFWVTQTAILDQRVMTPRADNGAFIVTAIDDLLGGGLATGMAARAGAQRPFTRIEALRRDAERRFLEEEQGLRERVIETERRLKELRAAGFAGSAGSRAEIQAEAQAFTAELRDARASLRAVQRNLRQGIESLETRIVTANIVVAPLIVALLAGLIASWRWLRRRKARP